jgi:hypothetical protein
MLSSFFAYDKYLTAITKNRKISGRKLIVYTIRLLFYLNCVNKGKVLLYTFLPLGSRNIQRLNNSFDNSHILFVVYFIRARVSVPNSDEAQCPFLCSALCQRHPWQHVFHQLLDDPSILSVLPYHDTHRAEDLSKQLCLGGVCTSKERRERESGELELDTGCVALRPGHVTLTSQHPPFNCKSSPNSSKVAKIPRIRANLVSNTLQNKGLDA